MRAIKKVLKVYTVKYTVYDSDAKEEKEFTQREVEGEIDTGFTHNIHVLNKEILSEEEKTFTMSLQTFIEYATIQE